VGLDDVVEVAVEGDATAVGHGLDHAPVAQKRVIIMAESRYRQVSSASRSYSRCEGTGYAQSYASPVWWPALVPLTLCR
jgi:hypothetical protein